MKIDISLKLCVKKNVTATVIYLRISVQKNGNPCGLDHLIKKIDVSDLISGKSGNGRPRTARPDDNIYAVTERIQCLTAYVRVNGGCCCRKFILSHSVYLPGIQVNFVYEGHRYTFKVTGAKKVENSCIFLQCNTSIGNNCCSIKHRATKFAFSTGFATKVDQTLTTIFVT